MLQGILEGMTKASTLEEEHSIYLWEIGQEHSQGSTAAGGCLGQPANAEGLASQQIGYLQHHCRCSTQ